MDGNVHTYKAGLLTKGFTQTYGVDYEEMFSPVADIRAIRILIAILVFYDYEIWQMDVKTAFLNGYLDEDIYMVQLEGFIDRKHPRKIEFKNLQQSGIPTEQVRLEWAYGETKEEAKTKLLMIRATAQSIPQALANTTTRQSSLSALENMHYSQMIRFDNAKEARHGSINDDLTTLSLSFWDYALESATRILNMVPTKKVDRTPYELWYGKVLNLSYLKVWGCEALVKRDTLDKL
ncbi:retrotransposon protein, putative, ty1-copia subclass [Tanacetum coccineum]